MKKTQPENRWQTILQIWSDNHWLYVVAGILIGLLLQPALSLVSSDFQAFVASFVPEGIGILITVLFINRLERRRDKENQERDLKNRLIWLAGSPIHDEVQGAIREIHRCKWLYGEGIRSQEGELHTDGILKHANLSFADLKNVDLSLADLSGTNFAEANLKKTKFRECKLRGAVLSEVKASGAVFLKANLQDAYLVRADLRKTTLSNVDLSNAYLIDADLRGADLSKAKLEGAKIWNIKCDNKTILPNGERWTSKDDWETYQVDDVPKDSHSWTSPETDYSIVRLSHVSSKATAFQIEIKHAEAHDEG